MIQPSFSAFLGNSNSTIHVTPPQPSSVGPPYRVLILGFWPAIATGEVVGMYTRPGLAEAEKAQLWRSGVSLQPTRLWRYQLISSGVTPVPQLLAIRSLTLTLNFVATLPHDSLSLTG